MVVLVDTNILIDALTDRAPFAQNARKIIELCARHTLDGVLAAHSVPNIFYILRKELSQEKRRIFLKYCCKIFCISPIDKYKLVRALDNDAFEDFEDCLQDLCATEQGADYIVTRNPADFANSNIETIDPQKLLSMLDA